MTLQERLTAAQEHAIDLYLKLQNMEAARQSCVAQISQIQQMLVKSDGEVELLQALIREEQERTTPSGQ